MGVLLALANLSHLWHLRLITERLPAVEDGEEIFYKEQKDTVKVTQSQNKCHPPMSSGG
jgi:hypothetical protein